MSEMFSNRTSVCNLICAVLLVILLIFQFTPFWHYGEEEAMATSINSYIWFPGDHGDLEKYLTAEVGDDYSINSILAAPIVILVAGAIGVVLCLWKNDNPFVSILPALAGGVGVWGYLTKAAMKLGTNWQLHLVLCIAILAVAVVAMVVGFKEKSNA